MLTNKVGEIFFNLDSLIKEHIPLLSAICSNAKGRRISFCVTHSQSNPIIGKSVNDLKI